MLDRIYGLLFTWIGGKDWKPSTFADWMPTDWRDSSQDRRKKLPLRDQLKIVAAAFKGKHGSDK